VKGQLDSRFWRIWVASAISTLGDGVRTAALPLLAATLTRNPISVAAVAVAQGLPWALFALLSGALVDRLDRRLIMGYTDLFRCVVTGGLVLVVATDRSSIVVLCIVAFCLGSAETMFDNASQAILPAVVRRQSLELANSRLQSVEILARDFVGPPLGALLFGLAALAPFALDSASFGVAAVLVLTLSGSFRVERTGPPTRIRADIAEGLRWLWRHRLIRTLAIMLSVWNLVSAATMAVFVLFALDELDMTRTGYGLLFTAWAVGGLLGSVIATRVISWLGHARALLTAVLIGAVSYTGMIFVRNPIMAGAFFTLEGVVVVVWNVITVSARQALVPAELFGRVNSVYRFVGWGVIPIGALIGGVVAQEFGLRAPFVLAAVTLAVMVLWARRIITRATFDRAFDEAPPPDAPDPSFGADSSR